MAGAQYSSEVTATSSGVGVAFGIHATSVYCVAASSGNNIWINITSSSGGVSSTGDGSSYQIVAGKSVSISPRRGYYTGLSYIAAATTTGYLKILAVR